MEQPQKYELTHPQQRIWYTEKMHPGTGMWNNAGTLKIKGWIDYALLERALNIFLAENDSIRLRIGVEMGEPYQYAAPYEAYRIETLDFSDQDIEKLYEWDSRQTKAPMPIIDSRLYYFAFLNVSPSECWLYAKFHHIISDALSIVQFSNQVMENYHQLLNGEQHENSKRPSYIDYVTREHEYLQSKRFAYDKDYWTKRFEDLPEPTILKPKKSNDLRTEAQRKVYVLNESFSERVREYCEKTGISVFALFLSALAIYINRVTGKKDIIIGAPVANRSTLSEKAMFGMFVSMVPVRIAISDELSFTEFSQIVSNEWFSALKHQKYPFDVLMHELHQTHKNLDSLYDVTLSYQYGKFQKNSGPFTYEGRWHFSGSQASALNIHVNDREDEGRFILDYDHHTPLFYDKEIEYFHTHLINIIRDMIRHPDKPLYLLDLMSEEERKRILHTFNNTGASLPQRETLTDLLRQGFNMNPEADAVICAGETMTYRELDERSETLAAYLVSCGVGRDSIVGLVTGRSMDYPVSVAAILKAGGAFLPIDPELPSERIAYMLSDSGAKILLVSPEHAYKCPREGLRIISTDVRPEPAAKVHSSCTPDSLAYVIYTSGSTGQPKGVQIEHHSIAHFAYAMREKYDLSSGGRMLCAGSISFDISILEFVPAFTNGLTLVLAQEHEANMPRNLVRLIQSAAVNMMIVTPGRMELLLSDRQGSECISDFREIGLGGDVLSEKLLSSVQQCTRARITNLYGPTEITICCTMADVTHAKIPSIGQPMPGIRAYILDSHQNPVPIGVPGELYIGGPGVARGYIKKPELTAERFIDNPFATGTKLYKTGDLARWYPQGEIEFLGRIDKQVKIRGFRIELGEIENRILKIADVVSCAVTDHTDPTGRRYLCAYLCGNPPRNADIKAQLERDLPSYMVPSIFITLESLPFNISGKVDRNQLPDPMAHLEDQKEDYQSPETATEQLLAEIWSNELSLARISKNDSFFDLGGDSLSILRVMTQIEQRFHVAFRHEDVYSSPRLCDMASVIDAAEQSSYRPILHTPSQRDYPVSSAQQRMWIVTQAETNSVAYNIPFAFEIQGGLDKNRLEMAFQMLINRHEALRTSFILRGTSLRQRIQKNARFKLETMHCEKRALKSVLKGLIKPFDMGNAPLMRAVLIETAPHNHVLFIDMHHSISDQRSMEIMLSDLSALYQGKMLSPVALEYRDYAVWQQTFMHSDNMKLQREYWKTVLTGELPLLNLHTDRPRPAEQHFDGARFSFHIDKETTAKLRAFAQRHGGTLFMAVLAVYNVLLMKYTGQEDIIVGTPTSGRTREELRDVTGVFINTLPLRCFPKGEQTFLDFYNEVVKSCATAFSNEDCPLERMIADIALPRDYSRNPLFDTMLIVSKNDMQMAIGNAKAKVLHFDPGFAKLDITLEAFENKEGLQCHFEYNKRLFKKSTIQRFSAHFCRLFTMLPQTPETCLADVQMMSQQEIWQVTQGFNQTDSPVDFTISVQSLLESLAKSSRDKTALIVEGKRMTFWELNNRANQIAHQLREMGVQRNTIVALYIRRSFDMVAGLMAVLKAGGGYLPLDPTYPNDRVSFMLEDSGARIILCDGPAELSCKCEILNLRDIPNTGVYENLEPVDRPEDAAYMIYTSGSTGTPKGGVLPRRALLNLYEGTKTTICYDSRQTSVSVTTVSFDIFVIDALLPLLFGCTVVLCTEEELRQPNLLANLIITERVKFIQTTPTRMRIMMGDPAFRAAVKDNIEKIVLGGEEFPLSLLKLLKKNTHARIISGYGPTETTVYCTFKDLSHTSHITIGKPIINTRMYILDKYRNPVPIGVLGEAYISGACVATGYIGRDDLNREKFIPDPYWPGKTMYQSGDICAFMDNGEMEIKGRVDHQVKIRGLRIELGEIEAAIREVKGVKEVIVKDWDEGVNKFLCAYFATTEDITSDMLRKYLANKLPSYMIPSFFIGMPELPLTLNGKVNRKLLQRPERDVQKEKITSVVLSKTEKVMSRIWSKILKTTIVDPDDSFFALGGDSLGVIKVQAALLQFGWTIRTQDFFDHQTLRAICARLNTAKKVQKVGTQEYFVKQYSHIEPAPMNYVLITGATGYLGAHIVAELLERGDCTVHCLVRGKNAKECQSRLREVLMFYFGSAAQEMMTQVFIVPGDISLPKIGLTDDKYNELLKVDTVIHCAAITDHIGHAAIFQNINVNGTRQIVDFSKDAGAALMHISTVSVSGSQFRDDPSRTGEFDENCFDIGQNYEDNEYARSKFMAEGIVLKEIEQGLNAKIFRVGVLTARNDGGFQLHSEKNAFANRLFSLCDIGFVPIEMLGARVEMTPVDECARAILLLAESGSKQPVFHVYNWNTLTLAEVVTLIENIGRRIEIVSRKEFMQILARLSKKGQLSDISGVIEDINSGQNEEKIIITAEMTKKILSDAGFDWTVIDDIYMRKFLATISDRSFRGDNNI